MNDRDDPYIDIEAMAEEYNRLMEFGEWRRPLPGWIDRTTKRAFELSRLNDYWHRFLSPREFLYSVGVTCRTFRMLYDTHPVKLVHLVGSSLFLGADLPGSDPYFLAFPNLKWKAYRAIGQEFDIEDGPEYFRFTIAFDEQKWAPAFYHQTIDGDVAITLAKKTNHAEDRQLVLSTRDQETLMRAAREYLAA